MQARLEIETRQLKAIQEKILVEKVRIDPSMPPKSGRQKLGYCVLHFQYLILMGSYFHLCVFETVNSEQYRSKTAPWAVELKPKVSCRKLMHHDKRPGAADTRRITQEGNKDGADLWENKKPRTPRYDWVNF